MRVLMLTQWFNPEPIFKGLTFAKELARRGHDVEVLTGFPNYPGGKIYPGYRVRWRQREMMEGIPVSRVPLYPSHDHSSFHRILNYGSFALAAATIGAHMVQPADVMHVYQPITIGLAATVIRRFRKIPYVVDIQDLWPDFLPATNMMTNPRALWAVGKWCDFVYKDASMITTLSPGFREAVIRRGINPDKVKVVYNWCDEDQVDLSENRDDAIAEKFGLTGKFNIVFAGSMGRAQALGAVLEAAAQLQYSHPDIQFVFVGGGVDVDRLKSLAENKELKNVVFVPRRPLSEIGQLLKWADVQLIHLKDDPLFATTIPSKTQTSLAVGRPILMGLRGDAVGLVESAGAGFSCIPEDARSIAAGVLKFHSLPRQELKKMGQNARDFYTKELSLKVGVDKFEKIFERILAGR